MHPLWRTIWNTAAALGAAASLLPAVSGCQTHPAPRAVPSALSQVDPAQGTPAAVLRPARDVDAMVDPPTGWQVQPLKRSSRHTHQTWLSPSGRTAYGVIHFTMPLPLSADFVLPFFISEMRRTQGEASLVSKEKDADLPGIRFVAKGGPYHIRVNLLTSGRDGWAVYAGTLRGQPIEPNELSLAEHAREQTRIGIPAEFADGR